MTGVQTCALPIYGSFFLDQNSQNRLTINETILPATSKVTGVIFYEQNLTLQTEDSQKINIDISANKIYSYFNIALNFILSPVKIQTTNIEPGGNNLYSLGLENFWKSIKVNEINMSEQYYSKNSNGYTYLPNGLMLQWWKVSTIPNDYLVYPITFSNACLGIWSQATSSVSETATYNLCYTLSVQSFDKEKAYCRGSAATDTFNNVYGQFYCFALGY